MSTPSNSEPLVSASSSTDSQLQRLLEIVSRSQLAYRELIDNLDHAVFVLSPDGIFRVANRYVAELFGVSFPELIGHPFDEFLAAPSRSQAERGRAVLGRNSTWTGQISVRPKKDGQQRLFDCQFYVGNAEGEAGSIIGWARDVTTEHQALARFDELFESLREGIFFTTPEGRLLDANPALVRMLRYPGKQEMQAFNFREVYAEPSQRDALVQEMLEKGSVQDRELVFRRKDMSLVHCLVSGFTIRDTFGRVVRLQGTLVDITERREIEKRLYQEQEFVRRLISNFPDVIAVLDCEGHFTHISPRVQDVLGYPPQEYIGLSIGERVHPEDREKLAEMFQKLIAGRQSRAQIEYRIQHADRSWRILRASAGPLFDADGKINGVVASARDITESKQSEQQAVQKEKLASMGQMMAGAAHELNNPLTAILGVSDLLRERASDDITRRQVEIVLQQARRAAGIVENLLALSRPAALGREKVRVEEIARQALEAHRVSLQQHKIAIEIHASPNLPSVHGDARLLSQMFSNFIVNAEQAISAVREDGWLRVAIERTDDKLCVTFADNGPGISPEVLGGIFDPFFTTKRPGGGSGLGLTICLAVAKEHGGTIEVQSSSGAGATFRLLLPLADTERPAQALSERALKASADSSPLRGHSILVVEDEESIREIVQEGLVARGMDVEGSANAEEALEILSRRSCEIVLCDFNLPGVSGRQFFEQLRSKAAGAAIPRFVFMTGELLEPPAMAELSAKGASVLQKPFHIAGLATLLSDLLTSSPAKTRH